MKTSQQKIKKGVDKFNWICYNEFIKRKEIQTMKYELRYLVQTWKEDKTYCIKQAVVILCGVALVIVQTIALLK